MKNKNIILITFILIFIVLIIKIISMKYNNIIKYDNIEEIIKYDTIYIIEKDSILIKENRILSDSLYKCLTKIDSFQNITDSIKEELLLKTIKLNRIKEYNRIAGKGNNIKFLRGWINRTLD